MNSSSSADYDVIVVGGGPAGISYALNLVSARPGVRVLVIEEHAKPGYPQHCAGLVSIRGLNAFYRPLWKKAAVNTVRGAIFYSPTGYTIRVQMKRAVAAVLDRGFFDFKLYEYAVSRGVRVLLGATVYSVDAESGLCTVRGKGFTYSCRVAALSTGAKYRLALRLGFPKPGGILEAFQAELKGVEGLEEDFVEVFLDPRYAPGLFAWIIPLGPETARVGLAARDRAYDRLRLFMKSPVLKRRLARARVLRYYAGRVITGGPVRGFVRRQVLVLGDTAGQTKPTTGGGLVYLAIASRLAAAATVEFLERRAEGFSTYECGWRRIMGRELAVTRVFRRILNALSARDLDLLVRAAGEAGFSEVAVGHGDMDMQARVVLVTAKKVLRSNSLLRLAPLVPRALIALSPLHTLVESPNINARFRP